VSNNASFAGAVCAAQHKIGSGLKVLSFLPQPMVIPGDAAK
jgi:hypothetical protein